MAEVRTLGQADLAALVALQPLCFDPPWSEAMLLARLEHPRGLNLGIFSDEALAGFVLISRLFDEAQVLQVGVDPQQQRSGLAHRLLQRALDELAGAGVERVMLEVRESNLPAMGLYLKLGFVEDGRRAGYYPTTAGQEAAVLMSVRLASVAPASLKG
jgi:ribosomal-protein-alanine N-acetyltransferase